MSRCNRWPEGGERCAREASVQLVAPDGEYVPGCRYCWECAERTIEEYRAKLGEEWGASVLCHRCKFGVKLKRGGERR